MSGLAAAFAAGGFLDGRLGSARRIGGGGNRGVGRIPPGAFPKFAVLGLQDGQLLLQLGDAGIAFPAPGTWRRSYRSFTESGLGHGRAPERTWLPVNSGSQAGTMAADKDAELIEVTHSVSIPIIGVPRLLGQVYKEKLAVGGGRRQNQPE